MFEELDDVKNEFECCLKNTKGCMALSYTDEDLTPEICAKCKFRKTRLELEMQMKRMRTNKINGFNLIFDNENEGYFANIKEIDNWLKYYWVQNKEKEYIPRDCEFNDYNVLFYTHDIFFKVI